MTSTQGNFSSYFNLRKNNGIIVGSGQSIPIRGYGHTSLTPPNPPLSLKNVLHAPKLLVLVSVRKFTTDNNVCVIFDPFGFSVNDLQTGTRLMRCDSTSELYPITSTSQNKNSAHSCFLASSLWHDRLGHPGASVLESLRQNKMIDCTSPIRSHVCQSCVLGKHIKLPFVASSSMTCMPFDIIHSDLWTSPVLSSSGHRYYVLFLDDFSKYLWTFPIAKKSEVFIMFAKLQEHIRTQFERDIKSVQCDNGKEFDNNLFGNFVIPMALHFVSRVHTLHLKMGKSKEKFDPLIIS
jgi:hypothetical protein